MLWCGRAKIGRLRASALSAVKTLWFTSDVARWEKVANEVPSWDERNRIIAGFIPDNSSVLDLGAGARLLKNYLKAGCTYQPCDVIKSSPDVIYCDFNAGIYPNLTATYDYVVCSGILEYIRDPIAFLPRIGTYGRRVILSYNVRRPGEAVLLRLSNGWVNHLDDKQLADLILSSSLQSSVLCTRYEGERIYELSSVALRCTNAGSV
jgi:hypothetical protein